MAPRDPDVDEFIRAYLRLQVANGGNPSVGRELGQAMSAAGLSGVVMAAMYDCYEDITLIAELLAQRLLHSLREEDMGRRPGLGGATGLRPCAAMRRWATQATLFAQSFVEAIGSAEP